MIKIQAKPCKPSLFIVIKNICVLLAMSIQYIYIYIYVGIQSK